MLKSDQDAVRDAIRKVQERITEVSLSNFDRLPNKTIKSFGALYDESLLLMFTDGTMIVLEAKYWGCDPELEVGDLSVEQAIKYNVVDTTELVAAKAKLADAKKIAEDKTTARKKIDQRKRRARQLIDGLHELVQVFGEDKVKRIMDGEEVSDLV